jgi:hypothetical protein
MPAFVTGAQDCHGGTVEIGSDVPLKKIGDGVRVQNGLHVQSSKLAKLGPGRDGTLCRAWVRRAQKAAAKVARFGAHFT